MMKTVEIDMAAVMAPYDWQLYVMLALCVLIGVIVGLLIADGRKAGKATKAGGPVSRPYRKPELPTIGSVRHGEKVVIDGVEWTIM